MPRLKSQCKSLLLRRPHPLPHSLPPRQMHRRKSQPKNLLLRQRHPLAHLLRQQQTPRRKNPDKSLRLLRLNRSHQHQRSVRRRKKNKDKPARVRRLVGARGGYIIDRFWLVCRLNSGQFRSEFIQSTSALMRNCDSVDARMRFEIGRS